jgi:5-methylcytosine-specific restriction endonuclease McrA
MGKSLNIDWNKYKHLLGTDSDNNLTKIINCSAKTIGNARKKFGIPALHSRKWTEEDINLTLNKKRKCTVCHLIKEEECFYVDKSRFYQAKKISRLRRQCISCVEVKRRSARRDHKIKAINLLGGKCQNCGFSSYLSSLQFHHVNSYNKEFTISKDINFKNFNKILSELDKCCLLCSNCHDALHGNDLQLIFIKANFGYLVQKEKHEYGI